MIYKFRKWVYVPVVTEIYINADTDAQAVEIINKLDPKSLSWKECPMTSLRQTYEIVKTNDKES